MFAKTTLALGAIIALLTACASAPNPAAQLAKAPDDLMTGAAAPGTYEVQPLEGTMTCYFGTANLTFPNGMEMNPGYLFRVAQNGSQVVMDGVTFAQGASPARSALKYSVSDGNNVTLTEVNASNTGKATFEGDPASWTAWTAEYNQGDRTTIKTDGKIMPDAINLHSMVSTDGNQALQVVVNAPKIDNEECNQRFSRVQPLTGL